MKLEIENVRGIDHKIILNIPENTFSVLKGENSLGKSSFLTALIAINTYSPKITLPFFFKEEARKIGLLADSQDSNLGFINMHHDFAQVDLETENDKAYLKMYSDSKIQKSHSGDMRFIFSSFLSRESKILRQLNSLDENQPDDFSWIVSKLSPVIDYEPILDVFTEAIDRSLGLKREALEKERSIIKASKDLNKVITEIEKIDKQQEKLKPFFDEKLQKLIQDKSNLVTSKNNLREKISKTQATLKLSKEEYENSVKEIEDLENQLKEELKNKKKENEEYQSLTEKRDTFLSSIQQSINEKKDKRSKNDGKLELFQFATRSLSSEEIGIKTRMKCPLCADGNISFEKINKLIKEFETSRKKINKEIMELSQEKIIFQNRILDIEKRIPKFDESISSLDKQIVNIKMASKPKMTSFQSIENKIKGYEEEISKILEKIEDLDIVINEKDPEKNKTYNDNELKKAELIDKKGELKGLIENTNVVFSNQQLNPNIAIPVLERYIDELEEAKRFIHKKIEEIKRKVASNFNNQINNFLNELNFTEFRSVFLNDNYRLIVERFDTDKKDYVIQLPQTLSTSEKISISILLLIALKEAFSPESKFLIFDDVFEGLDSDRRIAIQTYLKQKAEIDEITIISSQIEPGLGELKIEAV